VTAKCRVHGANRVVAWLCVAKGVQCKCLLQEYLVWHLACIGIMKQDYILYTRACWHTGSRQKGEHGHRQEGKHQGAHNNTTWWMDLSDMCEGAACQQPEGATSGLEGHSVDVQGLTV
jgi:hypothetical protein